MDKNLVLKKVRELLYDSKQNISSKKYNAKTNIRLKQEIVRLTSFLPESATATERLYCIKNDITQRPICPITNNYLSFCKNKKEYRKVSGYKFPKSTKKILIKRTEKYNQIIDQFWSIYHNKTFNLLTVERIKQFILLYKSKYRNFNIPHFLKYTDEICNIFLLTDKGFLKGVYNTKTIGERMYLIVNDIFEAPGCYDDPSKKATYENFNIGYRRMSSNTVRIKNINEKIKEQIRLQGFDILNVDQILNLKDYTFKLKCVKCESILSKKLTNGRWQDIYCKGCYGDNNRSKLEQQIVDYIKSVQPDLEIVTNFKLKGTNKELDIYIPSKQIGLEFNGILWHSFGKSFPNNIDSLNTKKYHINIKRKECEKHNITLINIFENEWLLKRDIVTSMLNAKLGIGNINRIYARKCLIKYVDTKEKTCFLNDNHIQGNDNSSIAIGLYYQDNLVSIMTFGYRKITGQHTFELIRFCNKRNTIVIGGASKLFKYFLENNWEGQKITTYADLRYSTGNLYKQLQFNFKHDSSPNYFYTKDMINLENRVKYQKHKLNRVLEFFDPNKTEIENMLDNEYRIIYDCGNKVFEYSNI